MAEGIRTFGRFTGIVRDVPRVMARGVADPFFAKVGFPNGYIASVVRHAGSYGGESGFMEVGVMHAGELVYDTPVTGDVIGWLDDGEVVAVLEKIEALPVR